MERHVYHFETIDASLDDVLDLVMHHATDVLGPNIGRAVDGDDPIHRLHAHFAGSDVSKQVVVSHGDLEQFTPGTHRMPISWHATDNASMYPVMIGELEFTGLAQHPPRVEVAFLGHYTPPLGIVGAVADRAVGHRIADEAITGFVRDVSAQLTRLQREHKATAGAS